MVEAVRIWKDKTIAAAHQPSLIIEKTEPVLPLQISRYSFKSIEAYVSPSEKLTKGDRLAIEARFRVDERQASASGSGEVTS